VSHSKAPFGAAKRLAGAPAVLAAFIVMLAAASTLPGRAWSQPAAELENEKPFLAENDAAMSKMMAGMVIRPSGDVDRDFVDMMVPHHQGAIDMAVAVLRYGHSEKIRRLAQEIIVTQQQEIAAMRLAVGEPLPPSAPSPTTPSRQNSSVIPPGMDMK